MLFWYRLLCTQFSECGSPTPEIGSGWLERYLRECQTVKQWSDENFTLISDNLFGENKIFIFHIKKIRCAVEFMLNGTWHWLLYHKQKPLHKKKQFHKQTKVELMKINVQVKIWFLNIRIRDLGISFYSKSRKTAPAKEI